MVYTSWSTIDWWLLKSKSRKGMQLYNMRRMECDICDIVGKDIYLDEFGQIWSVNIRFECDGQIICVNIRKMTFIIVHSFKRNNSTKNKQSAILIVKWILWFQSKINLLCDSSVKFVLCFSRSSEASQTCQWKGIGSLHIELMNQSEIVKRFLLSCSTR